MHIGVRDFALLLSHKSVISDDSPDRHCQQPACVLLLWMHSICQLGDHAPFDSCIALEAVQVVAQVILCLLQPWHK